MNIKIGDFVCIDCDKKLVLETMSVNLKVSILGQVLNILSPIEDNDCDVQVAVVKVFDHFEKDRLNTFVDIDNNYCKINGDLRIYEISKLNKINMVGDQIHG